MPVMNEFHFTSCNCRNQIYVRQWLPDGTPKGVLQIIHGVAEHISRYDDFARFMAENGYVVTGTDHLGHGHSIESTSELGYFGEYGGWELVVGDERKLQELLQSRYPNIPSFILGHSMGSFIARTYAIRYHDGPDGIIVCGTGQQLAPIVSAGLTLAKTEIKRHGATYHSEFLNKAAFGSYCRKIKHKRTDWDWLSSVHESVDAYIADPLCGFVPTAGLFRDMLCGCRYISTPRNVNRIRKNLPIFLISGSEDPVGEYGKGVLRAYNSYLKAGLTDVTLKLYNGGRHEILNDLCREDVYKDVLNWMQVRKQL